MNDSIKRWFLVVIGVLGAISSGALIIASLKSGATPGPSLASWVTDTQYSLTAHPSQFGFMLFTYIAGFIGFCWLAWRSYRN